MKKEKAGEYPAHVQKLIEQATLAHKKRDGEHSLKRPKSKYVIPLAKAEDPTPEYRSELEKDYAAHLDRQVQAGEILWWKYEPMSLNLGGGAKYKFDFLAMNKDCTLTCFETKGFWREAHRVRIKVAAAVFPIFRFQGITREKGVWEVEEF